MLTFVSLSTCAAPLTFDCIFFYQYGGLGGLASEGYQAEPLTLEVLWSTVMLVTDIRDLVGLFLFLGFKGVGPMQVPLCYQAHRRKKSVFRKRHWI